MGPGYRSNWPTNSGRPGIQFDKFSYEDAFPSGRSVLAECLILPRSPVRPVRSSGRVRRNTT